MCGGASVQNIVCALISAHNCCNLLYIIPLQVVDVVSQINAEGCAVTGG